MHQTIKIVPMHKPVLYILYIYNFFLRNQTPKGAGLLLKQ